MADKMSLLLEAERRGILSPEKQNALNEARSRGLVKDHPQGEKEAGGSFARSAATGFNKGLVDVVNLPNRGLDWLLEKVGLESTGGPEALEAVAKKYGMVDDSPEYPFVSRVGEEVGAASLPVGGMLKAAKSGMQGARFIEPMINATRSRPGLTTLEELAAALTAGTGGAVAKEVAPGSQGAEAAGQLIGGLLSPMSNAGSIARMGGRGIKRAITPLTPGGAKRSAADQLKKIIKTDPKEAVSKLSRPQESVPGAELTPAQELGDPGLQQLEAALGKYKPDLEQRLGEKAAKTQQALKTEADDLRGGGVPEQARGYYQERLKRATDQADEIINRAVLKAKEKIETLPDGATAEESSRIARDAIEDAYRQNRQIERDLWGQVDEAAIAPTKPLYDAYKEMQKTLKKAQSMPFEISEHLGEQASKGARLLDQENLGEVKAFRTKLREARMAEEALESPNRNKIRIYNKLEDAALDAMEQSSAANSDAFKTARDFSRQVNQKFKEGTIGKIRAQAKRGGDKVPAGQTLDQIIKSGPEGGENLDRLLNVAGDDKQAVNAVKSYIKEQFAKQVTDNTNTVSPRAAKRFLDRNEAVLNRLPDLKAQLSDAKKAQELAENTSKRMGARKASITDKNKSRAALFVDKGGPGGIKRVLNSPKPTENMKELARQAKADKTGGALKGVKADFIDTMMDSAQTKRGGQKVVSGRQLGEFLENNAGVVRSLFAPDEITRINRMTKTATQVEDALKAGRSVSEILEESPDAVVDLVSRIVGANIGAAGAAGSTGAPIVAAGAGSRFLRGLTNKLPISRTRDVLTEAILDRNKMRDLLTKVDSPEAAKNLERKINAWMINLIPTDDENNQ